MRNQIALLLAALFAVVSLNAAEVYVPAKAGEVMPLEQARDKDTPRYQARELSSPFAPGFWVGIYASARVEEIGTIDEMAASHEAGGGIEFGYSFSKNFSVALELQGQASRVKSEYLNEGGITVSYGIPFGNIKPYALAGAGYFIIDNREIDLNTWAGAGIEVGITRGVRGFADWRYYTTGYKGTQLLRAGIRKTF